MSGKKETKHLSYEKLKNIYDMLCSYTYQERIERLDLKPDRADVIIPAAKIFLSVMKNADIEKVFVRGWQCVAKKGEFKVGHYINSKFGKGICFYLDGIKTDIIDWKMPFKYPIIEMEKIRMASKEDILGMKLDIITAAPEYARYDKKDFVDLVCLFNDFSIAQMIEIYKQRHPQLAFPERMVLEGLQYAELADKKPNPTMLIDLSWEEVKSKIAQAIQDYLNMRIY
jgi:hypothetical protein